MLLKNRFYLMVLVAATGLSACTQSQEQQSGAAMPANVASKVNSGAVSVEQLDHELAVASAQNKNLDKERASQVLLEKLINQELLVQAANKENLNQNPAVQAAIERAKRQVLAQAYLEKSFSTLPEPEPAAIKKYFDEHPELFSKRKIYQLQEFAMDPATDRELISKKMKEAKTLKQFTDWLQADKIRVNARALTGGAERLPMGLLPLLSKVGDDKGILLAKAPVPTVVWKIASKDMPLTEEQATPFIRQYLIKQARAQKVKDEVTALRQSAKIEYVGSYAKPDAEMATSEDALPMGNEGRDSDTPK